MTKFKLIGAAFALTLSTAAFATAAADCCPGMACCKDGADCCDHAKGKAGEHADHAGMNHK